MEPNSIYYTFSTIPQVLAGVIALLGAFWIYRSEILNRKLKSTGRTILREMGVPIYGETNEFDREKEQNVKLVQNGLVAYGDINKNSFDDKKAEEWMKRLSRRMNASIDQDDYKWIGYAIKTIDTYANNEITSKTKKRFDKLNNEKEKFTKNIKIGILLSLITIIFNISILPFSKVIINNECMNHTLFVINGILFLGCVIYISYSVIRTLNIDN